MPKPVSKRQLRFMHAVVNNPKDHGRGVPPKAIASKYTGHSSSGLPEQSGENRGGTWDAKAHKRWSKGKKESEAKKKANMKKSFEQYYNGRGAGVIVLDKEGKILVGKDSNYNNWCTPGGHIEPSESFKEGAARELKEEAGIEATELIEIGSFKNGLNDCKCFVATSYKGKLKPVDGELKDLKFVDPHLLLDGNVRNCCLEGIKLFLHSSHNPMQKSNLKNMLALEALEKNINRTGVAAGEGVYEVTHGDALNLVGNGAFRIVSKAVKDMTDEDFRTVKIDTYILKIRKHVNDVYSGQVYDGNKMVHQFTNKSLPQVTVELMSVFEWYLPEDDKELEVIDEASLTDDTIKGGLQELIDNHKKHSIGNIYEEMESIREEMRHGMAVDLQQIEQRMMKLFDKLESVVHDVTDKHNKLCGDAGSDIDELEHKLQQLQVKIDELSNQPTNVEAYSAQPRYPHAELDGDYCYLSRPQIHISPDGKIKIMFNNDWNVLDRENLLTDMKAKMIKKPKSE